MASIIIQNAGVDFVIYNAQGRSLRNDILRRVGGKVGKGEGHRVTVQALRGIDLTVRPGDRLALVGHNGAGKSTLLRVMSGAYEPSSGSATIEGKVSSLLDLTMGMDYELTGRQNIVLRGVFLGMTFADANAMVPEIADFSELGAYLELPMRTYSSGMVLRLAFGVSTAVQPDIILLDEMISAGDIGFVEKAKKRLDEMLSRARILVLASHSPATLRQYCNRAVLLRQGQIVAEGPLEDILARSSDEPADQPAN
ncbi:ABC transporter ATP-binding protein [Phreatobacter stygius]|uniref:ABC transporter ATP-binding protein n=1 Tax=Phreatobacter stygius TaxID=1940610 RepID=A0A4D7AZK9_9HYPH|nr:ABC transporter ATP-binding protein [Phreatobacter stygius]QCI63190.1 ABC transporter ATP-binding protein [Phreatobacter stygius]